jgi:radial spoke head protein 9
MNIEGGLEEKMKYISSVNGICISIEERIKLETLLDQLKSEIKCDEMLFWGKIIGVEKDYYIAVAYYFKNFKFPKKVFYFCSSSTFIFSELSPIQPYHLNSFSKYNTYFIGNPNIILEKYDTNNSELFNEVGDQFKPQIKKKNLTESDRLSFVVRSIEHDTSIIPIGGFKILPSNELRRNDLFEGLSNNEIDKLEKYAHFRPVENQVKKDKIAMNKAVFDFDFLDTLNDEPVKESWTITLDSSKSIANIRSIIWPGYYAYHKANTDEFGGVYIGYGIKIKDIQFMQQ